MTARNEPAYPVGAYAGIHGDFYEPQYGLTKREDFAKAAMQGMLAAGGTWPNERDCAEIARRSVVQADALLAELSK